MTLQADIVSAFDDELSKVGGLKTAHNVIYTVTTHATDRIRLRFGIDTERIVTWVNDLMAKATLIRRNSRGQQEYESKGVRLIVDSRKNTVVTVYSEVSTSFLRPVLDRELRKMERGHTRLIRQIELDKAMTLRKYADMAINYAKARNPKTRELISERMVEVKAVMDGYDMRMERKEDEYKQRVRAIELIAE